MIKVKELTKTFKTYSKDEIILRNINFDAKKGELVTILGPSGGGKSTFLCILSLMLKPSSGEVYLNDEKVDYSDSEKLDNYRNRKIGLIFKTPMMISTLNPIENLTISMNTNESKKQKVIRARKLLNEAGLKGKEKSEICSLSREEVQKIEVVRSFVNYPKVIFCDEPTGNLDSKGSKKVMDILLKLRKKSNTTLIIATQDINIARLGNRKYYLEDGELNEIC